MQGLPNNPSLVSWCDSFLTSQNVLTPTHYFLMTDRHTAGECVADGPGSAGGAPLAGRHPAGVQEPEQEARRVVSLICLECCVVQFLD